MASRYKDSETRKKKVKKKYVLGRARAAIRMIRQFGGQRQGAPRKIRLGVTAFEEVQRVARIVEEHERGAAPKLKAAWL